MDPWAGILFSGWVVAFTPHVSPDLETIRLRLEVRRTDPPQTHDIRHLCDGRVGLIHLPDRSAQTTRSDLVLARGHGLVLAAGALRDGRPVTLHLRVPEDSAVAD